MSYQTILVHADLARGADARIRLAAALAADQGAHLVGATHVGLSYLMPPGSFEGDADALAALLNLARERAGRALARFEQLAQDAGVATRECRLVDAAADGGLAMHARYADLTVLSQYDPDDTESAPLRGLAEEVLLGSGRPVLVLPYASSPPALDGHAILAWDASIEATRAVGSALPLLKRARRVTVAVFNPQLRTGRHGELPGADVALYLARHGVEVEVAQQRTPLDAGNALLSMAADQDAGLLVMGAYGHARFRELLLGGVTRTVLDSMTLPVLMAH